MPKVSVIITNYNGEEFITSCLKSLEEQLYKDFEIIVVDNGSSDNSLNKIREFLGTSTNASPVRLIPVEVNLGFAGGNLEGLRHTNNEYIALLNNDTEPDKKWLGNLVAAMEANPAVGICASKMIVYGAQKIDSAGDGFSTNLRAFKRGEEQSVNAYNTEEYIFGACAGAALYRRRMLDEIGFFDEDFFLIHEDTDLNFRAQLSGWKVLYIPSAIVHHKVRSTIGHMSEEAIYYSLRNTELTRFKNVPVGLFIRCFPSYLFGTFFEFLYFSIKHGKFRLYIKAKKDVFKLLPKMLRKRKEIMSSKKVDNRYLYSIITPFWNNEFFPMKVKKFIYG